jgi:hypothetical protein
VFDFLKGANAQLNVTIDRPVGPYFPGDTVRATVSAKADKDFKFQQGRVALLYSERYEYRKREYDSEDHRWETNSFNSTEEHEIRRELILPEGLLKANAPQTWTFEWQIPPDAPPTHAGKILQIRWMVKATLDRKLMKDVNASAEFPVLSVPRGERVNAGEFGTANSPGDAQMFIGLPKEEWSEGETMQGKLIVRPQKEFDVTEVRVELQRVENVPQDEGNTNTVSVNKIRVAPGTKYRAGEAQDYPFTFQLPATTTPTIRAPHGSVSWLLKGTLARRLRSDFEVQEEIVVYSAERQPLAEKQQAAA